MSTAAEVTYSFNVEWYDSQAEIVRPYKLIFYTSDQTLEMFDLKNRRTFLKRCSYPSVSMESLFPGAQLTVYARQLKVTDFGDDVTRNALSNDRTRNLLVLKPSAYSRLGAVIDSVYNGQLLIGQLKMVSLSPNQACDFLGDTRRSQRAEEFTGGRAVAIEVIGSNVAARLAELTGERGPVHFSSERAADAQCKFMFQNRAVVGTAKLGGSICVIKPHALLSGVAGKIVGDILASGFEISAMEMFNLDIRACEEFYEVYKGVIPEYHAAVEQLISGPCIALEINGGADVVEKFRAYCGPNDPEVARHIRPDTLRAKYGQDKVKNAVHCTDLPEDGPLESEFFFSILQGAPR